MGSVAGDIPSTTFTIDDSDTKLIVYEGNWKTAGVKEEFNSTTHWTQGAGSKATLVFNGTGVAVFGTVGVDDAGPPMSTYNLDNSLTVNFTVPRPPVALRRELFFRSPTLQNGQHSLVISITSTNPSSTYFLDYVQVDLPAISPTMASTPTTVGTSNTSVSLSSATSANNPSNSTPVGAIVGGSIGGALLLMVVAAGLFLLYRRRQKSKYELPAPAGQNLLPVYGIAPFSSSVLSYPTTLSAPEMKKIPRASPDDPRMTMHTAYHPKRILRSHDYPLPASSFTPSSSDLSSSAPSIGPVINPRELAKGSSRSGNKSTERPNASISSNTQLHEDGGVRLEGGPPPNDVPPVYRPYH